MCIIETHPDFSFCNFCPMNEENKKRKKNFRGLPSSQPIHQPFMGNSSVASAPTKTLHWRPFLAHQRCIVPDWLTQPRKALSDIFTQDSFTTHHAKTKRLMKKSRRCREKEKKRSHARKPILTLLPFDNWTNGSSFDEEASSERIASSLYFRENTGRQIKEWTVLHL